MNFDVNTIKVLENFSSINKSIMLTEGNVLRTKNSQTMIAKAVLEQDFPQDFGVYDLTELLRAVSLFKKPTVDFKKNYLEICEGPNKLRYVRADSTVIPEVPNMDVTIPEDVWSIRFSLSSVEMKKLQKAAQALSLSDFSVTPEGIKVFEKSASDNASEDSNFFTLKIEDMERNGDVPDEFNVDFKMESMILIPQDYRVSVSGKKRVEFRSEGDIDVVYWIAAEKSSRT